jgi:VanZ family protein
MPPPEKLRFFNLWFTLGVGLLAIVAWFSLMTSGPEVEGFDRADLLLHLSAYGLLTGWFQQLFPGQRGLVVTALFMLGYGGLLEIAQHWFPPRETHWSDFLANASGILLASLLNRTALKQLLGSMDHSLGRLLRSLA